MNKFTTRAALTAAVASLSLATAAFAQQDNTMGNTMDQAKQAGQNAADQVGQKMDQMGNEMSQKMSSSDSKKMVKSYIEDEASQNLLEQKLGKLAQQSDNQQIKQFGQTILDAHDQSQQDLKKAAESAGVSVPDSMTQYDQAKYDALSKLSGKTFDMAYANAEVGGHITDILGDMQIANNCQEQAVKSYARNEIPTQQKHLQMISKAATSMAGANDLQSVIGGGSMGGMNGGAQPAGMSQPGMDQPGATGGQTGGGTGGMTTTPPPAGGNMGGGNMNNGQ